MYIVLGVNIFVIICLIILNIVLLYKYIELQSMYYMERSEYLHKSNQLSMIEYHYRNFREGKNPYTVFRDIGDILYNNLGASNYNGEE